MTVICPEHKTCDAKNHCRHAREHEPFIPWLPSGGEKFCNEGHECNMARKHIKCVEAKDE